MFTIEIKINGSLVGHIYGHNEGHINAKGETLYRYEYYEVETRRVRPGTVRHVRKGGIRSLVVAILSSVE